MTRDTLRERRLPVGAELLAPARTHFRVWAPDRRRVAVVLGSDDARTVPLTPENNGYHSAAVDECPAGTLYRFQLDDDPKPCPDPASRFQPEGVHGPSQVVDPATFRWTDANWKGVTPQGQVLYEMHVGTFTPEGTWDAAAAQLAALRDVGVTCLEVMPVAEFPGRFGWGYDGVDLFAPTRLYGDPDAMRRFVDRAHSLGIGVILDVVYNHVGPDGNYLPAFSPHYFSDKHKNDWGQSLNFDGPHNAPVREFFLANARYWIDEYHLDGFRFDATQAIFDDSPRHILAEICQAARAAGGSRAIYLVNENEPQDTRLVRGEQQGGYGLDSLWNDDFHHSATVALTGKNEAYYTDHLGSPQEFVSSAKYGYLFQGQRYKWQAKRRGTPALDLPPHAFVNFIQNHDQIANSGQCVRTHFQTSPGHFRAMTGLLLLLPQTPMLFQGQEYAASQPFRYFADHNDQLARQVRDGRRREISQFPSVATSEMQSRIPDPDSEKTFQECKLDPTQRTRDGHRQIKGMHADLLRLRRENPALHHGNLDGAVLGPSAFVLRFFGDADSGLDDRLLLVNFGTDLHLTPAPEPLLAPPLDQRWTTLWSSDSPDYNGPGTPAPDTEREGWLLPARCTLFLAPSPAAQAAVETRVKKSGTD